jgi:hypothetical protein
MRGFELRSKITLVFAYGLVSVVLVFARAKADLYILLL